MSRIGYGEFRKVQLDIDRRRNPLLNAWSDGKQRLSQIKNRLERIEAELGKLKLNLIPMRITAPMRRRTLRDEVDDATTALTFEAIRRKIEELEREQAGLVIERREVESRMQQIDRVLQELRREEDMNDPLAPRRLPPLRVVSGFRLRHGLRSRLGMTPCQ